MINVDILKKWYGSHKENCAEWNMKHSLIYSWLVVMGASAQMLMYINQKTNKAFYVKRWKLNFQWWLNLSFKQRVILPRTLWGRKKKRMGYNNLNCWTHISFSLLNQERTYSTLWEPFPIMEKFTMTHLTGVSVYNALFNIQYFNTPCI